LALPDGKVAAGGYSSGQFFCCSDGGLANDRCMEKVYARIVSKKLEDIDCFAISGRPCMKKLYSEATMRGGKLYGELYLTY